MMVSLKSFTLIQRYVAAERAHSFMVGINQSVAKTNKQLLKHLVRGDTGEAREAPWGDEWFSSETCRVRGRAEEGQKRKPEKRR